MNILALDLGKYKTVFCNYNPTNGEHEFGKVSTMPQEIHDLIVEKEPQKVVLEVCHIAGWIVDIAKALGIDTEVANTTHDACDERKEILDHNIRLLLKRCVEYRNIRISHHKSLS